MGIRVLLDSIVNIYRFDAGQATGRLGEPSKVPSLVQTRIRASFDRGRSLLANDKGAGDRPIGIAILMVELKANVLLNDVLKIVEGPNRGQFWIVDGVVHQPTRGKHKEGYAKPYVGQLPND